MAVNKGGRKRKLFMPTDDEAPALKKCFSNLTNLNTGRNNTNTDAKSGFVSQSESSQSGEILVAQVPDGKGSSGDVWVNMMRNVKSTLEHNFKSVTKRLQLPTTPPCLYEGNLKQCHQLHSNKDKVLFASNQNQYLAKSIIAEERSFQFIQFVRNNMCGRQEFPGIDVIRNILELMLKIPNEKYEKPCISQQQVLTELYSLFTSILITFPTCLFSSSYLQLFQSTLKVKGIVNNAPGILSVMLELISSLINEESTMKNSERQPDGQEQQNNFFLWDAQIEAKSSFNNFQTDEKLERVFLVVDLLAQILENDLAMFIVRNSNKLFTRLDSKRRPLICSVIWQDNESVILINETIKKVISIFVKITCDDHPKPHVEVISRLLNLISQVTNLYEYPDVNFEYPNYKQRTMDLVQVIQKSIEDSYYCEEFYLRAMLNIKSPLIRMLLANTLLQKINNTPQTISLKVPFDCISNKQFKKFTQKPFIKSRNKSPKINPKHSKRYQVTSGGYLKLLQIYTEAFIEFYAIKEASTDPKPQEEMIKQENACDQTFDFQSFEKKLKEVDLQEKVKLRDSDTSFKKLVHLKMSLERCEFYRTETKYFFLLAKLIPVCQQKFAGWFDDWNIQQNSS